MSIESTSRRSPPGSSGVAIFCNSFPPEGGGASNRIYNMAVLLRDAGYRVQVICAMPNYPTGRIFPAYRRRLVHHETLDGIAVKRVWMMASNSSSAVKRGGSMLSFVLSLRMLAYRSVVRSRPALVIVSSPPLPMAADVVRYFNKQGVKVLLNVSDIWPLSASALGAMQESPLYRLLRRREQEMYRRADAFMAQSGETLRHIERAEPTASPAMLYLNLPADAGPVAVPALAQPIRIIYPGLLGHAQGILAICEAIDFRSLGASLHIYGAGAGLPAIEAWIAAHSGAGVQLHQPVSPHELMAMLPAFHGMLIPLIAEISGALPSKLFTAIQAGLPVLYSGGSEGASLVSSHQLGWVSPPGDYAAIAENIAALSRLPADDYAAMRRHILETGRTAFNKKVQDERFLDFIENLALRS